MKMALLLLINVMTAPLITVQLKLSNIGTGSNDNGGDHGDDYNDSQDQISFFAKYQTFF